MYIKYITLFRRLIMPAAAAGLLLITRPAAAQQTDPVAENMLVYQRSYGGWPKALGKEKVDYNKPLDEDQIREIKATADDRDATIDNKATSREIVYLMKAYGETKNKAYLDAARKGIDYLFRAQYENGGWPQFYPDNRMYRAEITYNDDAMVNVLNIMLDISRLEGDYAVLGDAYAAKAKTAVERGVSCILRTQLLIGGKLTAWAAQYDEKKLTPAKARAFELPALASSESANILKFLMRLDNPTAEIRTAVTSGVAWFDQVKISGYKTERVDAPAEPKGKDVVLIADPSSTIWARFYDLETMQPQFVGRDSVPRTKLADIENERRVGYAWYGVWGAKLPKEYEKWQKKNGS